MDHTPTPGATTTLAPTEPAPAAPAAAPVTARTGTGRRGEIMPVVLLTLAGALAYIPTAPFYFRPDDDGAITFDALLVLQGQRPYLDFFVHDSPLLNYWHALLLQLGGLDMLTLRYGLVPFKILLLPAIYLLARPLAPRWLAAVAALLVLMADSGVNFGTAHPGWYGMALAFLGLLAVQAWLGGGRGGWLLAAGAALGLSVAVKQNLGLFVLAACGLFLLEPLARVPAQGGVSFGRGVDSRGLWALRALAWAIVLAGLLVMFRAQLRADVLLLLWLPLLALAGWSLWPVAGPNPPAPLPILGRGGREEGRGFPNPPAPLPSVGRGEKDSVASAVLPSPYRGGAGGEVPAALGRVGLLVAGAALVLVPWLLILGAISGFDQLLPGLVLDPSVLPGVMFFPYKPPPPEFWQVVLLVIGPPLVAGALLRLVPRVPVVGAVGATAWVGGVLLLWGGPDFVWQGGIFTWYYIPPALVWLALLLPTNLSPGPSAVRGGESNSPFPAWEGGKGVRSGSALYRRFLLYAAGFGMLQLYPLMDRVHGAWSYPFTLPLLAVVLAHVGEWLMRAGRMSTDGAGSYSTTATRRVVTASLLVLPLFWGWFIGGWRIGLWWDVPASLAAGRPVAAAWQPLAVPHASLVVAADAAADFQGIVRLLDERTRPGEPIYAFPNEQAFYIMADRPRGSRQSYLLPGVTTDADQREAIADLEGNQVRVIVVYMPATSISTLAPLAQYLAGHYHPIGTFGPPPNTYAVMERN